MSLSEIDGIFKDFTFSIDLDFFHEISIFFSMNNILQSAIKAKLLELGSGSQTGYIDDELPDYVMIMVANKRSQSQMLEDLKLFLGQQTGERDCMKNYRLYLTNLLQIHRNIRQLAASSAAEASGSYAA